MGITRKAGTRAECPITFTGKDGARVPAGTPFFTAGGAGFLLLSVPGVLDFTDFTLNGGKENLSVEADAVPVVGTVELT